MVFTLPYINLPSLCPFSKNESTSSKEFRANKFVTRSRSVSGKDSTADGSSSISIGDSTLEVLPVVVAGVITLEGASGVVITTVVGADEYRVGTVSATTCSGLFTTEPSSVSTPT